MTIHGLEVRPFSVRGGERLGYQAYGHHEPSRFLAAVEARYGNPPERHVQHWNLMPHEDGSYERIQEPMEGSVAFTFLRWHESDPIAP